MSIYIDLDGTLISEGEHPCRKLGHTESLLNKLRSLGKKCYMITNSDDALARRRNRDFSLGFKDDEILAGHTFRNGMRDVDPKSVLVENNSYMAPLTRLKCEWLGIGPEKVVLVDNPEAFTKVVSLL